MIPAPAVPRDLAIENDIVNGKRRNGGSHLGQVLRGRRPLSPEMAERIRQALRAGEGAADAA